MVKYIRASADGFEHLYRVHSLLDGETKDF